MFDNLLGCLVHHKQNVEEQQTGCMITRDMQHPMCDMQLPITDNAILPGRVVHAREAYEDPTKSAWAIFRAGSVR